MPQLITLKLNTQFTVLARFQVRLDDRNYSSVLGSVPGGILHRSVVQHGGFLTSRILFCNQTGKHGKGLQVFEQPSLRSFPGFKLVGRKHMCPARGKFGSVQHGGFPNHIRPSAHG